MGEESALNADGSALFLQACGMQGPLELEILEPGKNQARRQCFSQPVLLVGRGEQCSLRLNDPVVSRRHAYLQLIAGRVFFVDLGSRTGIVAQSGTLRSGWLDPGQELRLGDCTIRLTSTATRQPQFSSAADRAWNPVNRQASLSDSEHGWLLEYGRDYPLWPLNRVLTLVGRAADCKLRIEGRGISRYHAAFLHTPTGVWLIDLRSREGTFLNGSGIQWALLEDGCQIRIGPECAIRAWQQGVTIASNHGTASPKSLVPSRPPGALQVVPIERSLLPRPAPGTDTERLLAAISSNGIHPEQSQLAPVIQQLSLMQQQMFDQFQQTLLTMAQMFCSMQREQMTLVRQELDRVHQLTDELQGIQEELKKQASRGPAVPAAGKVLHEQASRTSNIPVGNPIQTPPPAPSGRTVESTRRVGSTTESPKEMAGVSGSAGTDIHKWLSQRLVALQEERQSRLRKVLGMILGKV
jgi:pSer/pThr/pTyr-binding forkhead associated (FHA) protein